MNKRITQARQPNPRQRLSQNRETAICKTSRLGALRQRGAAPTVNMKDITPPAPAERAFAGRRQPADAPPAARRISKDITAAIDLMLDFGHLVTQCIEGSRRVGARFALACSSCCSRPERFQGPCGSRLPLLHVPNDAGTDEDGCQGGSNHALRTHRPGVVRHQANVCRTSRGAYRG